MENSRIFKRASDPKQYDSNNLRWKNESTTARSFFFFDYLKKYLPDFKDKNVLDIGSGDGWLLNEISKEKPDSILGIEPSKKNNELSKEQYPNISIFSGTFEDFKTDKSFDRITSLMSFCHIEKVEDAFKKVNSLLSKNGEFILIVPDFEYSKTERSNYEVKVEDIDTEQYAVELIRPSGALADIVRKNSFYIKMASENNLKLIEEIPMLPTKDYITRFPNNVHDKNKPTTQLLRFLKNN